jgi:hypothetical protein
MYYNSLFIGAFFWEVYKSLRVCGEGVLVNVPWKVMEWKTIPFVSRHPNKAEWNW